MPDLAEWVNPASVRRAIDPTFRERDLPTDAITDEVYVRPAIVELLSLAPDAADSQGDDLAALKVALNLLVAANLLPSVPLFTKEDFGDGGGYTRQQMDVSERVAELRRKAAEQVSLVVGVEVAGLGETPPFIVVE
ncbi:MAG TPA: hypothetical protein VGV38_03540 [Pyrinomonadaceae bacterium]|nr:hypothetical protein [Pyrinomonadaceae bacterium]